MMNCSEVTMSGLSLGTSSDGTNIGDYVTTQTGRPSTIIPNDQMTLMQSAFYNKEFTLAGYNSIIQQNINKYSNPNAFQRWFYDPALFRSHLSNLNKIK